jgi:hypothetical protein
MLRVDSMAGGQWYPDAGKQQDHVLFKYRIPTWVITAANNAPCAHTCRTLMQAIYIARHLAWPSEMLLLFKAHLCVMTSGEVDVVVEEADVDDQQD